MARQIDNSRCGAVRKLALALVVLTWATISAGERWNDPSVPPLHVDVSAPDSWDGGVKFAIKEFDSAKPDFSIYPGPMRSVEVVTPDFIWMHGTCGGARVEYAATERPKWQLRQVSTETWRPMDDIIESIQGRHPPTAKRYWLSVQ